MYNNCKAMRAGTYSYTHLRHAALLGPKSRGSGSGSSGKISGGNSGSTPFKTTLAVINSNKQTSPGTGSNTNTDNTDNTNNTNNTNTNTASSAEVEMPIMGTHSSHTEGAIIGLAFGVSG